MKKNYVTLNWVLGLFKPSLSQFSKASKTIVSFALFAFVLQSNFLIAQCSTCTYTVTGTSSANINLNSSTEVVCIETGAVWTGGVNANNGGTICIKQGATVNLGSINGKPNVENSGTITLNFNMATGQVINNNKFGKMTITGVNFNGTGVINNFEGSRGLTITSASFQLGNNSKIYNEDTIRVTQGLSTASGTEIINKGWIYVKGNHFNPNGLVNNYGVISTSEFLNMNSNAVVNNYCWFIGDAFNFNGTAPFKNYGGIWVGDASQGWRVNNGTFELGPESIIYSVGEFLNSGGTIKLMDQTKPGAQFYVEGLSKNQGTFGIAGDVFNFNDLGATQFDVQIGTVGAGITFNPVPKPDTNVFASSCEARVSGKPAPIIDLDDNNSTTTGVDYLGVFTENGGGVRINDTDIKITESTSLLDSAIIVLSNPLDGTAIEKLFAGTMPAGITATVSANGSQIKLAGQASLVSYQNAISAITYNNTSENPTATSRIIYVTIYNPAKRSGSAKATLTISKVNDNPIANPDVNSITEGTVSVTSTAANQVLKNDTDIDLDVLTVSSIKGTGVATAVTTTATVAGKYGSLTINANGTYTYSLSNSAVDSLFQGEQVLDVFTYIASDGKGGTSSSTLTLTITGVNDAPVANPDVNSIAEGTASVASTAANQVLKNDVDVDGNPLTVSSIKGVGAVTTLTTTATVTGKYGSLKINSDGSYIYTLSNSAVDSLRQGQQVLDVFTYTANDGITNSTDATLTITIDGVNDAPLAVNDVNSITEGTASVTSTAANQVLKNDTDVDRNPLTVSSIKGTAATSTAVTTTATVAGKYGSLKINSDGSYIYTLSNSSVDSLKQGQQVLDVFTYTANDGITNSTDATLTITITGVNDAPVAVDDVNVISEGTVSVSSTALNQVLVNDTDVDKNVLTVSSIKGDNTGSVAGKYGTLTWSTNGSYTYTLNNNAVDSLFVGEKVTDVFPYVATDGIANSSANLTITITGVNDAPKANPDVNSMSEETDFVTNANGSGTLLSNDTDVDGDALTVTTVNNSSSKTTLGTYGTLTWAANGTYTYDLNNALPAVAGLGDNQTLTETYTYRISDGNGGFSNSTLTITITGGNSAPVANPDNNAILEDQVSVTNVNGSGTLVINDTDTDLSDVLVVTTVNGSSAKTTVGTYGTLTWLANGTYTYTLNNLNTLVQALGVGAFLNDVFTYAISDGNGGVATSALTVKINGVNDVPKANPDVNTITEGVASVIETNGNGKLVLNDTDVDAGDVLVVSTVNGSTTKTTIGKYGTLTWIANGSYTYTLNNASVDSLTQGELATEVFNYVASDGNGGTSASTLTITITGINDAPVAINDTKEITEGAVSVSNTSPGGTGALIANDTDVDGNVLTVQSIKGNTTGTVSGKYGTLTWLNDGSYTYTLNNASVDSLKQGQQVVDVFPYVATDGIATATANLTVTVTGVNDAPVAVNDTKGITEGAVSVSNTSAGGTDALIANDTDVDGNVLTIQSIKGNTTGTVSGKYGTLTWLSDGTYTYVLNNASVDSLKQGQQVVDVFPYVATDGIATATANLTISVTGVNDAPIAVNDTKEITEGAESVNNTSPGGTGALIANDTDADGNVLTIQSIKGNSAGTVTGKYGTLTWLSDGTYTYTLNNASVDSLKQGQQVVDVFPYVATDGIATATATLTVTVTGVNDSPVAVNDTKQITEGTASVSNTSPSGTGALIANDTDVDGNILTVLSIKGNTSGTVIGVYGTLTWLSDGTYTYALNNLSVDSLKLGQQVVDVFPYVATDGIATATANLTITVIGANDAPKAVNDENNMSENVDVITHLDGSGTLLVNDSDIDKDFLSVTLVNGSSVKTTLGALGTLTWDSDGTYSYDLNNILPKVAGLGEGEILKDTFKYQLSDGKGGFDEAFLIITITGGNSAPIAKPDVNAIFEDSISVTHVQGSGTLISNDLDLDATDVLVVTTINGTTDKTILNKYGSLSWNSDGSYTYTLDNSNVVVQSLAVGEKLEDVFTYVIIDNNGGTSSSTLTITIKGTNDKPVANPDQNIIFEDQVSVTSTSTNYLALNDTDTDATDVLILISINGKLSPTEGEYGVITWDQFGNYTYVLDNTNPLVQALAVNETLSDTFVYVVSDGNGGLDTSRLVLTIIGKNDQTIALDDVISISEDSVKVTSVVSLLNNDSDLDATDVLIVQTINGTTDKIVVGTYGTIEWNEDGTYVYVLDNTNPLVQDLAVGESRTDTFVYVVSDGNGGLDTAKLVVTINGVNDKPVALDDLISILEDEIKVASTVSLLNNDSDLDGTDVLVVQTINGTTDKVVVGNYGTIEWDEDGTYVYILNNTNPLVQDLAVGESRTDTFVYVVSDGNGGLATAKLVVTINGVNDKPFAVDDVVSISEDSEKVTSSVSLLNNDSDVDGTDVLVIQTINGTTDKIVVGNYGTIEWSEDGTYVYVLDNTNPLVQDLAVGESRTDTFVYVISDGNGGLATAKLVVTINGVNDKPVAVDDVISISEDSEKVTSSVSLLNNDSDVDGTDVLVVQTINGTTDKIVVGNYGTIEWNEDGTYVYVLDNTNPLVQDLAVGESRTDTFVYVVSDGNGGLATAKLVVTVNGVNDQPKALDDANTIVSGAVSIGKTDKLTGVLSNDSDVDKTDVLSVTTFNGITTTVGSVIGQFGTLTWNVNGSYLYTLNNANALVSGLGKGQSLQDVFTYELTDGNGGTASAKLTITVDGANEAPKANADVNTIKEDVASISKDSETGILTNDTDVNSSDELSVETVNGASSKSINSTYGTFTWNTDGSYTYTLDNTLNVVQALDDNETLTEVYTYTVSDGKGGSSNSTLTITILGVNDAPIFRDVNDLTIAIEKVNYTMNENTVGTFKTIATDVEEDPLTYTLATTTKNGIATINPLTGLITYTPVKDFYGTETIFVDVCDDGGLCDRLEVIIEVKDVNSPPIANDDKATVKYQGEVVIAVLDNDTDPEGKQEIDPTTVVITKKPKNGTVSVDPITGEITYIPRDGFQGQDSFEYEFSDLKGAKSNKATVLIDVDPRPPFKVFEAVTPNGDGKNDYMHIQNIEYYPNTNVQIFNRWGNLVWELPKSCDGYQNGDSECSFTGKSNIGLGSGGQVTDGSYYYVVDGTGDGVQPCQGYLVKN